MALHLVIHHNIFLTRNQRYALFEGIELVVVGVSVPVWVKSNQMTSEPAREVFCRYYLSDPKNDVPIKFVKDGYEVALPNREGNALELSNEDWRLLNSYNPQKLEIMYQKCQTSVTSKNLLDVRDGGSAGLTFREHNRIEKNGSTLNVMHYVCIEDIEILKNSLF